MMGTVDGIFMENNLIYTLQTLSEIICVNSFIFRFVAICKGVWTATPTEKYNNQMLLEMRTFSIIISWKWHRTFRFMRKQVVKTCIRDYCFISALATYAHDNKAA